MWRASESNEPNIASSSHIQRDLLLLQSRGGRVCASLPRPHDVRWKRGLGAEETRVTTMCAVTRGARQGNGRTRRGEGQGLTGQARSGEPRASSHLADLTRSLSRPPRREGAPALSSLTLSLFSLSVRETRVARDTWLRNEPAGGTRPLVQVPNCFPFFLAFVPVSSLRLPPS